MKDSVSFIGVGNMAGALLSGILRTGAFRPERICLFDCNPAQYEKYAGSGYVIAESETDAAIRSDFLVLSIKPQNYADVLRKLRAARIDWDSKVIISLGAGLKICDIRRALGADAPVIRTLPNTPVLIGRGVTALAPSGNVAEEDFAVLDRIFSSCGVTVRIPEEEMNGMISVTSSSPAYFYLMIDAMAEAAKNEGVTLPKEQVLALIAETAIGSARMVLESGRDPDELIWMVRSPHGTTEQALNVLDAHAYRGMMAEAMRRCTERAEELSDAFASSVSED